METPSPLPLPPLPDTTDVMMEGFLTSLSDVQRRQFYKVLRSEFNKILPLKSFNQLSGVITYFWMLDAIRKRHGLTSARLAFLTLLYYATDQGRKRTTLDTILPFSGQTATFLYNHMDSFYKAHYLERRGELYKYLYITPEAIKLIRTIHQELHEMIYKTHIPQPD